MTLNRREAKTGSGDWSPGGFGIVAMRPLCGIQHGGNRKSQGALARLCEFPGISPPKSPKNPITPIETSRNTLHPGTGVTTRTNRPAERVRGLGYGVAARCGVRGIRNASLPDSCFFMNRFAIWGYGVTIGLPPKPAWGFHPQTPARNFVPCTLSPLRGYIRRAARSKRSGGSIFSIWKDDLT